MPLASGVTVEAVERALTGVEALIHQQSVVLLYQDAGREDREREYFAFHRLRFRETLARMTRRLSPGARVLDVGSHFLHMALSLQALGFRVDGVDTERYAAHPALAGRLLNLQARTRLRGLLRRHRVPGSAGASDH